VLLGVKPAKDAFKFKVCEDLVSVPKAGSVEIRET